MVNSIWFDISINKRGICHLIIFHTFFLYFLTSNYASSNFPSLQRASTSALYIVVKIWLKTSTQNFIKESICMIHCNCYKNAYRLWRKSNENKVLNSKETEMPKSRLIIESFTLQRSSNNKITSPIRVASTPPSNFHSGSMSSKSFPPYARFH